MLRNNLSFTGTKASFPSPHALQDDISIRAHSRLELARRGKRLMIGPWGHETGIRKNSPSGPDFGPEAEIDKRKLYLRWMDYWLKGIDNGVAAEPPIKIFVMGENYWRYENGWPLARTRYTNYYIQSGGSANSVTGDGTLEISSSNFPRFDRNLNTGEDPATGTRMERATQTVYHSARYPSHVILPIIPGAESAPSLR